MHYSASKFIIIIHVHVSNIVFVKNKNFILHSTFYNDSDYVLVCIIYMFLNER